MAHRWRWLTLLSGVLLCTAGGVGGSGCTVQQQQQVLGTIGKVIPGSSTAESTASSAPHTAGGSLQRPAAPPSPAALEKSDAQWVLQTMQKAMTDNPSPFQECLDNPPCRLALTAHLIQLQKQAGGTLELPAIYDRYDLKRGKE